MTNHRAPGGNRLGRLTQGQGTPVRSGNEEKSLRFSLGSPWVIQRVWRSVGTLSWLNPSRPVARRLALRQVDRQASGIIQFIWSTGYAIKIDTVGWHPILAATWLYSPFGRWPPPCGCPPPPSTRCAAWASSRASARRPTPSASERTTWRPISASERGRFPAPDTSRPTVRSVGPCMHIPTYAAASPSGWTDFQGTEVQHTENSLGDPPDAAEPVVVAPD